MLNIVVALATESRPLVDHFRLSEDGSVPGFRVFVNERIRLIVTGTGRVSCAAGVATLAAKESGGTAMSAWLNLGIAGHKSHSIGDGVHAVSILEAATGRRWYPAQVLPLPGNGEEFCTVDAPETRYAEPHVYEMEASAFYATALRYSTSELVQVYKIISDNRDSGIENIDKLAVRESINEHLPTIEDVVEGLSGLSEEINATRPKLADFDRIVGRWHFTVAQQHQLRKLLREWGVLFAQQPLLDAGLNRCPSAKSVLAEIGDRLNTVYDRVDSAKK